MLKEKGIFVRCVGNEVVVEKVGGRTLVCCGLTKNGEKEVLKA